MKKKFSWKLARKFTNVDNSLSLYKRDKTCQQHVKQMDHFCENVLMTWDFVWHIFANISRKIFLFCENFSKIYVFPKVIAKICVRQEQMHKAALKIVFFAKIRIIFAKINIYGILLWTPWLFSLANRLRHVLYLLEEQSVCIRNVSQSWPCELWHYIRLRRCLFNSQVC